MRTYYNCDNGFHLTDEWKPEYWANIESPDEDDYAFLRDRLDIPDSFLQYVADNDEQPHVERDDDWMMTIIRVAISGPEPSLPFYTVPLGIITGKGCMVTVSFHKTHTVSDLLKEAEKKKISIRNDSDLTLRLINSSANRYLLSLRAINKAADSGARQLRQSVRNEDLLSMLNLQKSLVYFTTSLQANQAILDRIKTLFGPEIDHDLLDDVAIELRQALDTSKVYSDILESTMDTFASVISNNVNLVMKRMTAVSIALMVPTLIASFYGMNVDVPMGNLASAFWIIVAFTALLTAVVSVWFRIIKWS